MSKYLVSYVKPYDFADDEGRRRFGVKVYYLEDYESNSEGKGHIPLNLTLPDVGIDRFPEVPGFYDLDLRQTADRYGKPVLRLRDVTFVEPAAFPTI